MSISDEEHQFWDEIILNDDGTVDLDAVYAELHDFRLIMEHASRVYYDITCGIISKPNADSSAVISQANECAENVLRDEILDVLHDIQDGNISVEEAIREYDNNT